MILIGKFSRKINKKNDLIKTMICDSCTKNYKEGVVIDFRSDLPVGGEATIKKIYLCEDCYNILNKKIQKGN